MLFSYQSEEIQTTSKYLSNSAFKNKHKLVQVEVFTEGY